MSDAERIDRIGFDLPATFQLLSSGQVSEHVASLVVSETRNLAAPMRREVDAKIVAAGLAGMGPRRAAACARRCAYAADPHGFVERGRTERKHRRVGLRPAPDTMAILSGYLPAEQGWLVWPRWADTPTHRKLVGISGAGTRFWPTPWWHDSPATPPPMSTLSCS